MQPNSRTRRSSAGFTLIEVMVVVAILAILAAVVVPRVMDEPAKARTAKVEQDIRAIESALDLYKLDNFNYPTTDQGLEALVSKPGGTDLRNYKDGGYLRELPVDPWGNQYQYMSPGQHGEVDVFSLGADGAPGGDGNNADVGNWNTDA
ncbi:MAG: type II secretion system major pseudopilin GspG [Halofilum sp. (in: g-proteobacteria)]